VFRYNTLNDCYAEVHAFISTFRSGRKWEMYNNTISQSALVQVRPFFIRGGTGVVFNNTVTGTWTIPNINVDNRRSTEANPDLCDGDSSLDGNEDATGWPCRDQIGRSAGDPNPQESEPMYVWNNTLNGNPLTVSVSSGSETHVQENRDYFHAQRPGYTPFTYPHPLRGEGDPPPDPPTNLRVIVR
jgi:hypothetical protein